MRSQTLFLLFLVTGIRVAAAQNPTLPNLPGLPSVDSMLDAEYSRDSLGSITMGVVRQDQVIWVRSVGFADRGTRRLATAATVYRIGSITKMFTGLMLQQLLALGKVRLSDSVARFYPDIHRLGKLPPGSPSPTILQLATMTAGLAAEPRQEGPFWNGPVSGWESTLAQAVVHSEYEFPPGTRYSYSNLGYAILGAALARAAGMPYLRWQQERILDPLGLEHTAFDADSSLRANLARGYAVGQDGAVDSLTPVAELNSGRGYKVPNGALFTTVDDLSRFLIFELGHGPAQVLAPAGLDSAFQGIVAATGDLDVGYGLGFMVQRRGDFTWLGHAGGVAGYSAMLAFDREHQLGVIILRNVSGGKVRVMRLAAEALKALILAKIEAE